MEVLYEYGGIYLDTDMEILKNIDKFLSSEIFTGFEDNKKVAFGIFGATRNNDIVKNILQKYDGRTFFLPSGLQDNTTIVTLLTDILKEEGLIQNGKNQKLKKYTIYILSPEYFYPKNVTTKETNITENTYAIHHYNGSWLSDEEKAMSLKKGELIKKYGTKLGKVLYYVYFVFFNFKKHGLYKTLKILKHKYRTSKGKI